MGVLLGFVQYSSAQSSLAPIVTRAGNIVANGGFEARFAGWQGTFGYLDPSETGHKVPALEGGNTGVVIDVGSSSVSQPMWQILRTTPGARYEFGFSLLSGYGLVGEQSMGNEGAPVRVYWGGSLLGAGAQYLGEFRNSSTTTWQTYGFEVTAASSSTMIQFVDYIDKRWQLIDAVSVVEVPEPSCTLLALCGLGAFGLRGLMKGARLKTPQGPY